MNLISKIALSFSAISLLTLVLTRVFLGGWIAILWLPFGFFILGILVSLIFDVKHYWSFINMKTTKGGMSLGLSIVMMVAVLSSIAYLSVLWNKTFDLTEEKLNSLSEQTTKVLDSMKKEGLKVSVFYKGPNGSRIKRIIKANLQLFTQYIPNFKVRYYNAEVENVLAGKYLKQLSDKRSQDVFIFIEYLDKKVRVNFPFNEETFLSSLIQVSKRTKSNVYFTVGHGERDLFSSEGEGARAFREALEQSSFNVVEWNFIEKQQNLPKDAQALMILGPSRPFFEQEIQWIKEYIQNRNGRVWIALDPGTAQNLTPFISETLGIDFKNNFISSVFSSRILNKPSTSVLGMNYHVDSPITKMIRQQYKGQLGSSIFDEVSEVTKASSIHPDWQVSELVHSDPSCSVRSSLDADAHSQEIKSRTMAVAVQQVPNEKPSSSPENQKDKDKEKPEEKEKKKKQGFVAVVFGDSNFLTNRSWLIGVHKDLALNTISYLADQGDLVSIRPKVPKGTQITMTRLTQYLFISFAILFSLLFFIFAIASFIHRKKA